MTLNPALGTEGQSCRIIVVWGAPGAPGGSTFALNLAAELGAPDARSTRKDPSRSRICLIDLDCWAPALAPLLGARPATPGAAAAARLAEIDAFDESEFTRLAVAAPEGCLLLSGLSALDRWPELSGRRCTALLRQLRRYCDVVVIDAGAHVGADEPEHSSVATPRRSAAVEAALEQADLVIGVGAADPIGLARVIRAWPNWHGSDGAQRLLVINRVRAQVLGAQPNGQVTRACEEFLGVRPFAVLPNDPRASDKAVASARPLRLAAPNSPLAQALARTAEQVAALISVGAGESQERAVAPLR